MLPSGPRYTYPPPATPQVGARQFAQQVIATIANQVAAATTIRPATTSTGCDGQPNINPLNGTACNGAVTGPLVLYNPQTMTVLSGNIGRMFAGSGGVPGLSGGSTLSACAKEMVALRAKRRFIDQLGNTYGPDGLFLTTGAPFATLETDYVHRMEIVRRVTNGDPPRWEPQSQLWLDKVTPVGVSLSMNLQSPSAAQGMRWGSVNDITSQAVVTDPRLDALSDIVVLEPAVSGLNDIIFGGAYGLTDSRAWKVKIDGTGTPDTFSWGTANCVAGTVGGSFSGGASGVPITGGVQALSSGVTVKFLATTGHTLNDSWYGSATPGNRIIRPGVAARGIITTSDGCVAVNQNVLVTVECRAGFPNYTAPNSITASGSHALVVRDANTLALLYRKTLMYDTTSLAWGDPPQKFSLSTNNEGFFFLHCYTVPVLTSPPTPYPGAEFGSPNSRKVAVISINPSTFEPTIVEVITLQDSGSTADGTFAVATSLP